MSLPAKLACQVGRVPEAAICSLNDYLQTSTNKENQILKGFSTINQNLDDMDYFFVVRILLALLAGFWVARYFRAAIRGLVIRLMPLKYRMSEQSFHLQSRISTALAILIALAIGFIVNQGLNRAIEAAGDKWWSKSDKMETFSFPAEPESVHTEPEPIPSPEPDISPVPSLAEEKPSEKTATPDSYGSTAAPQKGSHYLQVSAFDETDNAWRYYHAMERRYPGRAHLGKVSNGPGLYKALLGPFPNRAATLSFRARHNLQGFPRDLKQVQLLQ